MWGGWCDGDEGGLQVSPVEEKGSSVQVWKFCVE